MDIYQSWLVEKFIAHRGFFDNENQIPENSLLAFEKAIENGYAIELDVHVIADGTVVVFHDNILGRMTGQDGYIGQLTKDDLSKYHLLDTEQTIPTLQQVFDLVDGKTPILIEIKSENLKVGADETKIYELLKEYKGEFAVQSFNPFTIEWFKNNAPEITRGLLSSKFKKDENNPKSWVKRYALRHMTFNKRSKPQFIAYNVLDLPANILKGRKFKGLPILGWTVKSQSQYMEVVKYVDNIIFQDFKPSI
ncbi:MAG: glycerophosphodiester phosphodiesterase [Clostridia bacterium]|nr:glycerophosphodiester phosphodiesterase [Clostridia bacterium]